MGFNSLLAFIITLICYYRSASIHKEEKNCSKNNKHVSTLLLVTYSHILTPFRVFKSSKVVKSSKAKAIVVDKEEEEEEEED